MVAKEPHGETGNTDPLAAVDSEPTTVHVARSKDVQLPESSPRGSTKKRPRGVRSGGNCNGGGAQVGGTDTAASSDLYDGDAMVPNIKRRKVEGSVRGWVTSGGSVGKAVVKLPHDTYDITMNGEELEDVFTQVRRVVLRHCLATLAHGHHVHSGIVVRICGAW